MSRKLLGIVASSAIVVIVICIVFVAYSGKNDPNEKWEISWSNNPSGVQEFHGTMSQAVVFGDQGSAFSRGKPRQSGATVTYVDWDSGQTVTVTARKFSMKKWEKRLPSTYNPK